jgi:hypothetical protein
MIADAASVRRNLIIQPPSFFEGPHFSGEAAGSCERCSAALVASRWVLLPLFENVLRDGELDGWCRQRVLCVS